MDRWELVDDWLDAEPEPEAEHAANLRLPACIVTDEQRREAGSKRFWWVIDCDARGRGADRPFVDLGGRHTATGSLAVRLPDGVYLVGAGPSFRRDVVIRDGEVVRERIPCMTVGCPGVIEHDAGDPPPACDPFDLAVPRKRLCGACRGDITQ